MFPADDVETFESLVDEIERVPAIRVGAVRLGREEEIREYSRRGAARNGGQHGTFGRIPVPHGHPAPQPAFECGEVGLTCQRRALSARGWESGGDGLSSRVRVSAAVSSSDRSGLIIS